MSVTRQLVEKALAKVERAEAVLHRSERVDVSYENDRLKSASTTQSTRVGLRVINKGLIASVHSTTATDLDELVGRAVETVEFGSPARHGFAPPAASGDVRIHDEEVEAVSKEEMVAMGAEMLEALKAHNRDILVGAGVGKGAGTTEFANSNGHEYSCRSTRFHVGVGGQLVRGTDILSAGEGFGWRGRAIDHRAIARKAVRLFELAEHTAPIRSGDMPVVFAPSGLNVLLLSLVAGCNGKNVALGASPLSDKMGKAVAAETFTLTDDPLMDYAGGSSPFDGEGVARRPMPVVERGILANVFHDLDSAGRLGAASTGHGQGGHPSNLAVTPGDTDFTAMLDGIDEGLLVHEVMGLGQGNVMGGAFSVNVHLGYKIEKGELVGRVKDVMLAGNAYEALKRVDAIGSAPEWTGGPMGASLYAPYLRVGALSVTSK